MTDASETPSRLATALHTPPYATPRGDVQMVQRFRIRGWAFCPSHPDEHLTVEASLDGVPINQGVASLPFPDLERKQIGKGDHGFVLNCSVELPVDEPERIQVVVRGLDGATSVLPHRKPAKPHTAVTAAVIPAAPEPAAGAPRETIFRFAHSDRSQRPVFVLGSGRSGTSAMALALLRVSRYAGFNEGHLLDLIAPLQAIVAAHYAKNGRSLAPGVKTFLSRVPADVVTAAIHGGFVEIVRTAFPDGYWVDKTPGPSMIRAAPLMQRIWPHAKFIFMKRRPIENIQSRLRKFPQVGFREHCQSWADCMMAWHQVRDSLRGVSLEVEQAQMAGDPEPVAGAIAELIDLNPGEQVQLLQSMRTDQPQRTSADFAASYDIATLGWTAEQLAIFQAVCGEAIELFGYDLAAPPGVAGPSARPNRRNPANC